MGEQDEIDRLRDRMHMLVNSVHETMVRVEVTATRQEGTVGQLDRIEASLRDLATEKRTQNGRIDLSENRLTVLETRADEARNTGSRWGAGAGSLAGFLGGLLGGLVKNVGGGAP